VEWQDVPGPENRAPFTVNNGSELNGPLLDRNVTVLDEAFTLEYGAVGWAYDITYEITTGEFVDHVDVSPANAAIWAKEWAVNTTQDGYPWQNMTFINNLLGFTPSSLNWPYYQYTTPGPGYPGYYNTSYYMQNFVRPDASLNSSEISVYMSAYWPWQTQYFILGQYVLPMDIFSHLSIGAWYTKDQQGKRWLTSDVCYMDLEPYSYNSGKGADLLYGSGPYILVDDASAIPTEIFRLDAYTKGLTYGPGLTGAYGHDTITTDHSYFLATASAIVIQTVAGTQSLTSTSPTINPNSGPTLSFGESLKNINATGSATVNCSWAYEIYDANGDLITSGITSATPSTPVAIGSGSTQGFTGTVGPINPFPDPLTAIVTLRYTYLGKEVVTSGFTNTFTWGEDQAGITGIKLILQENYTGAGTGAFNYQWKYNVEWFNATSGNYDIPGPSGASSAVASTITAGNTSGTLYYVITLPKEGTTSYATYDNTFIVVSNFTYNGITVDQATTLNYHPGDIAGTTALFGPYWGADGIVNTKDLKLMANNWLKTVPSGTNPTSNLARADIDNVGTVNTVDLKAMAKDWLLSWPYP